jgi:hypothetical protein
MTEPQTQALEKLDLESKSSENNGAPSIPIYQHLRALCEQDEAFAALVTVPENAFAKCLDYVMEQMKAKCSKQNGVQCVGATEAEVYGVAEEYYRIGEVEFERRRAEKKAKEKAESEARDAQRKAREAEEKKAEKSASKKAAHAAEAETPIPAAPAEPAQLSMF